MPSARRSHTLNSKASWEWQTLWRHAPATPTSASTLCWGDLASQRPISSAILTPKVADLMDTTAISVPHDSSVYEAIRLIRESNLRALPVVDAENRCVGVLPGWKVSNYLFPSSDEALDLGLLVAAIGDIVNSFNGEYLAGEPDSNRRRLVIVVGAMSLESLLPPLEKRRLGRGRSFCWGRGRCSVSGDRCRSLGSCHHRGMSVSAKVRAAVQEAGTRLVSSRFDTATSAMLSRGAVRVKQMIDLQPTSFWPEMPIRAARQVNFLRRSKGQRSFLSSRCSITTG
jgi:manganese-dependent inorganic pyrophosphatase